MCRVVLDNACKRGYIKEAAVRKTLEEISSAILNGAEWSSIRGAVSKMIINLGSLPEATDAYSFWKHSHDGMMERLRGDLDASRWSRNVLLYIGTDERTDSLVYLLIGFGLPGNH